MTVPVRALRLRGMSVRLHPRSAGVCVLLFAVLAVLVVAALATGEYLIAPGDVLAALAGGGTRAQQFVVTGVRAPRVALAVAVGAALGVSGALVQSLARNVLASPDLLGFTAGASTGALVAILAGAGGTVSVAVGASAGTALTALALLAILSGGTRPPVYRLVLVGIGVNATLIALNDYLVSRAPLDIAATAQLWLVGSLNGASWARVLPAAVVVLIALLASAVGARYADLLATGDDVARGLGVSVDAVRVVLLGIAVLLVGVATAASGPFAFVALVAPQVARRLVGSPAVGVIPAALTGALLLLLADLLAARAFGDAVLPAGVVTGLVGGLYLAWLLARVWRRAR